MSSERATPRAYEVRVYGYEYHADRLGAVYYTESWHVFASTPSLARQKAAAATTLRVVQARVRLAPEARMVHRERGARLAV